MSPVIFSANVVCPHRFSGYPAQEINAAVTYTIHFINLLSFYLGVKLPFEIQWSGNRLGVGIPMIGAGPGGDTGGWSR